MTVALTADDIKGAIGLDFASQADRAWADVCAAGTNSYVNGLPIALDPAKGPQVLQAATLLAVDGYNRRPAGSIAPDFQSGDTLIAGASQSVYPIISRLLELGQHEQPWMA